MSNKASKKGFTLIELLLVIAIIGILASALLVSLGGARRAARDARRISDLRQIQSALELYFNACGYYPGVLNCGGGSTPGVPADWDVFQAVFTDPLSTLGISKIPDDPIPTTAGGTSYAYAVNTDNANQNYVLRAVLETNNPALNDDLDDNDLTGAGATWGPSMPGCNDSTTSYNYCVGI